MNVRELIEFLQRQPQDLLVAYQLYSEQALLEDKDMHVRELGEVRPDGWVPNRRDDMPTRTYLVFPGN